MTNYELEAIKKLKVDYSSLREVNPSDHLCLANRLWNGVGAGTRTSGVLILRPPGPVPEYSI